MAEEIVVAKLRLKRRSDLAVHEFFFSRGVCHPRRGVAGDPPPIYPLISGEMRIASSIGVGGGRGGVDIGTLGLVNPLGQAAVALIGWDVASGAVVRLAAAMRPLNSLLAGYHIGGGEIQLMAGAPDDDIAAMTVIFSGKMEMPGVDRAGVTLAPRDAALDLDVPVRAAVYAGDGDMDGGADLKDKTKEVLLGRPLAIEPTYLGLVESGLPTWSLGGGDRIDAVVKVRSGWVDMEEVAVGAPGAGQWRKDLSRGIFWVGGAPQYQITAEARGAVIGGVYRELAGDLLAMTAVELSGALPAAAVVAADVAAVNAAAPWPLGVWLPAGAQKTARALMDEIAASVGAWWRIDHLGRLRMGMITPPQAALGMTILRYRVDHLGVAAVTATGRDMPAKEVVLDYAENFAVGADADLDRALSPAAKSVATNRFRSARATSPAVAAAYGVGAEILSRTSLIREDADAAAAAAAFLARESLAWSTWSLSLRGLRPDIDVGDLVIVYDDAPGFDAGRAVWVIGVTRRLGGRRTDLIVRAVQ